MILRTETVEQVVDGSRRVRLVKEVVMTPGAEPLGMVRKRPLPPKQTRGAVLLIHGFGQNRYTWHGSSRSFSAFLAAEGWDVFNADLRGHGRSRRFGSGRARTLDAYILGDVPTCAEEAMRLSGHEQIFLIGHSMGGLVSYCAAATSLRARVRGIVTIGSPYRFGHGSRLLGSLAALLRVLRFTGVLDSNPHLPLRFVGRHLRKRRALWDKSWIPAPVRAWTPGSTEEEILDEYLERAFDWTSVQVAYDILRNGRGGLVSQDGTVDYGSAFEHLDRPLLVIAGDTDTLAPPESVRPAYARSRSSDRTYRVYPMGHVDLVVGREAPSTVWATIGQWMAQR